MEDKIQVIPAILILENKEKFRRKMLITSRIIAIALILAIFYIGYIQIKYVAEVNKVKAKYGSLGYCYYCGLETYRKCSCQYVHDIDLQAQNIDLKEFARQTALNNIIVCPNLYNNTEYYNPSMNFSFN